MASQAFGIAGDQANDEFIAARQNKDDEVSASKPAVDKRFVKFLAQDATGQTLPQNPSGLGPDWKDVTPQGGQNPKIPKRYQGPKGTQIEFDPANPEESPKTWGGRDHWHEVGPDGKREGEHLAPGSPMPGPDGKSTPAERSMMDQMRAITPAPLLRLGTAGVIIYIILDEGSRLYPPRNLVPIP